MEDTEGTASVQKRRLSETESHNIDSGVWERTDSSGQQVKRRCIELADLWKAKTTLKARASFKAMDQSIGSQITNAMEGIDRLVEKSRPGTASIRTLGRFAQVEEAADTTSLLNPDVYDDHEFYIQLLKDSVQLPSKNRDPIVESEMLRLTNYKKRSLENQKRSKCDRRASKGRKLRYTPISQLINFMVASPLQSGTAQRFVDDGLVDRLLHSLFSD